MAEYTKSEAMDWARENIRGQWTTLMTPFTPEDELDEDGLRRIYVTSDRWAPMAQAARGVWESFGA